MSCPVITRSCWREPTIAWIAWCSTPTFRWARPVGGLRTWWRQLHGSDANLNDDQLRDMAGTLSRRLRAYCARHQVPVIEAEAGQRKHELAEKHLPQDPKFRGLFR